MNTLRAQIFLAIQALIEEENGVAFQRLAYQCLSKRWPSLMATAEKADLGEDGITVFCEGDDGVVRSLACSLTAEWRKVSSDANKIHAHRHDVQELIFATPKKVTRNVQEEWKERIRTKNDLKLIVVEYSEFVAILERPDSKWICEQHLGIHEKQLEKLNPEEDPEAINTAASRLWDSGANNQAHSLYDHAYKLALAQRKPKAACHALLGLAWCALVDADSSTAFGLAINCLAIAEEAGSLHYKASANIIRARVALTQRNFEDAQLYSLNAVADGKTGKSIVQYDATLLLVEISLAKGDPKTALKHLDSVYRKELKRGGRRAMAVGDLRASICVANGQLRLAATTFERVAKKAKEMGNLVLHASYLAKAQRALADAGAHRAVLNRSAICEQAAQSINNVPLLLEILLSKSWAYKNLRKFKDAIRTLERVAPIAESKQYHDLAARAFIANGQILRGEGNLVESRLATEKGLSFAKLSGKYQLVGFALVEMAELDSNTGDFEAAQRKFDKALYQFGDIHLPADYRFEIDLTQLRILEGLGKYKECLELLNRLTEFAKLADNRLPGAAEWIESKKKEFSSKAEAFETVNRILSVNGKEAKKWAGTEDTQSLGEANQWVIGTLLDWWDGTRNILSPPMDVLNLWGEANYGRIILNHRAYQNNSFHLCVNISSVEEARIACRMLAPICDCLTLVWTGEILPGIPIPGFPRHLAYDQPSRDWKPRPKGFWKKMNRGYPVCMPPYPRCLMPEDIVLFFLDEARNLTERGRLLLVPGPGVGFVGQNHSISAQRFHKVSCATAVLKVDSDISASPDLDMVIPWFPKISIKDLSKICEDYEDNFIEFRWKCMEWGEIVQKRGAARLSRIYADIQSLSKELGRVFRRIQGSADPDGQMAIGAVSGFSGQEDARNLPTEFVQTDVTHRLSVLAGQEIMENPWFPYWSFSQKGSDWQLGSAITSSGVSGTTHTFQQDAILLGGKAFHWLRAPGEHKMYVMLVKDDSK